MGLLRVTGTGQDFPNAVTAGATLPASQYAITGGSATTAGSAVAAGFAGNANWSWSGTTWSYSGAATLSSLHVTAGTIPVNVSNTTITGCTVSGQIVTGGTASVTGTTIYNCAISQAAGGAGNAIQLGGTSSAYTFANTSIRYCNLSGTDATTNRLATGILDKYGTAHGSGLVIEGCEIYNCRTAIQVSGGAIQGNYVHDMGYQSGDQVDCILCTSTGTAPSLAGGLTISGNTLFNNLSATSVINLGTTSPGAQYVTIAGNFLAGGSYSIYGGGTAAGNIVVTGNRFSEVYYATGGLAGVVTSFGTATASNVWDGNVIHDTGASVGPPTTNIVASAYGVGTPEPPVSGLTSTALTEDTNPYRASPERGIFYYTECHYATDNGTYSGGGSLSASDLAYQTATYGYTICFRYFYMEVYNSNGSTISTDYMNLVANDISTCRAGGMKLVLRFAYSDNPDNNYTPPYDDGPNVPTVEAHVASLMPLLDPNGDVIFSVQMGFIGYWGENYYTDYFCYDPSTPYDLDSTDWANRTAVLDAIYNGTSNADCFVQVRYIGLKQGIYPLDTTRVGFHDDALGDPSGDYGTFDTFSGSSSAYNMTYLSTQTTFPLPLTGEGAGAESPGTDWPSAGSELAAYHWTSLNNYTPASYGWSGAGSTPVTGDTATAYKLLGYRLVGSAVRAQASRAPGQSLRVEIDFANNGYAAPMNNREVVLVLDTQTGTRYNATLAEDFRQFTPAGTFTLWATLPLPGDMPAGTYHIAAWFPDSAPSITANANYAAQLVNTGTWNGTYGYNQLTTLTVT